MHALRAVVAAVGLAVLACCGGCAAGGGLRRRAPAPPPPPPAVAYLNCIQDGIDRARAQMPTMIESADRAAARVASGGRLFVGGSQPEFARALVGRPGGLQMLQHVPELADRIDKRDVILYAARSKLTPNDNLRITRWRDRGAMVIAFASAAQSDDPYFRPDVVVDSGPSAGLTFDDAEPFTPDPLCPTDTVLNLLNGWTWTGEFVSACTRVGPPPVIRDAAAPGSPVIGTGVVGMAYLDRVEEYLAVLRGEAPEKLRLAGAWVRDAGRYRNAAQVASNLFPEHFADDRAAKPFGSVTRFDPRQPQSAPCLVVIGNGDAPQLAVAATHLRRSRLIYASVPRAADDGADHILRLAAPWPAEERCVTIEGYDAPALPASDVLQPALYWSLVAEAVAPPAEAE